MTLTWIIEPPIIDPCPSCNGSGAEWPRTKSGRPDRRYKFPVGPCPGCHGKRVMGA